MINNLTSSSQVDNIIEIIKKIAEIDSIFDKIKEITTIDKFIDKKDKLDKVKDKLDKVKEKNKTILNKKIDKYEIAIDSFGTIYETISQGNIVDFEKVLKTAKVKAAAVVTAKKIKK